MQPLVVVVRFALVAALASTAAVSRAQTNRGLDGGALDAGMPVLGGRDGSTSTGDAGPMHIDGGAFAARADEPERASAARLSGLVHVLGLRRTRASTVTELLPRHPPATYTDLELLELERRLDNLGVFDDVTIRRVDGAIEVSVREKWTLIPTFDLQRGKTFRDTFLVVGATEYNFLGTASSLSALVYHEERGWNGELAFGQHGYHPGRGAWMTKLEAVNSGYRFEEPVEAEWYVRSIGGSTSWSMPLLAGRYSTYEFAAGYHYENVDGLQTDDAASPSASFQPPDGHELFAEVGLFWDRYHWTDLSPQGVSLLLTGGAGGLFASDVAQERLLLASELAFAQGLWRHLTLMGRWVGRVSSRGNVNFSGLLGGLEGVRGLDDALYRNWAQTYLNLELRQTIPLVPRLAAQAVLFSDAAAYRQLDQYGRDSSGNAALSAGFGARLIPTFLAQVLLRVDAARLILPRREWFVSWGLSQYF
jgi:hypothetical protein